MEPLPIVGITIGSLIIILNMLEIHCLHRKGNRKSNFECIILSLSCSDLMIGFIYVSGWIWILISMKYSFLARYEAVMITLGSLIHLSIESSVLHLTIIAVERLIAILMPLKLRFFLTKQRTKILLGMVWATCIFTQGTFTLLSFLRIGADKLTVFQGCLILIVGSILAVTHVGLVVFLKTAVEGTLKRFTSNSGSLNISGGIDKRRERKVELTCLAVVLAFIVCNFPIAISWISNWRAPGKPHPVIESMFVANSVINSLLYFWGNAGCRQKRKTLRRETLSMYTKERITVTKVKTLVQESLI